MAKLSRRSFLKTLGVGALAGVGTATYAQDCANWLSVERSELALEKWDASGFKIALLADLHMNNTGERERAERAMRLALSESPDVLIIAGDFVNHSTPDTIQNINLCLGTLAEVKIPCFAVMGNHDYWCTHPQQVIKAIQSSPVKLLRNEMAEVQGVTIAGVDDAFENYQDYEFFPPHKVSKSLIGILHEPDYVEEMPGHVSLQLSGHTHGGQVCLPFGVPMHTPKAGRKYVAGYFPEAQVPLYVTRGVGTSGVDYRLFCRPEVTILTLRSA